MKVFENQIRVFHEDVVLRLLPEADATGIGKTTFGTVNLRKTHVEHLGDRARFRRELDFLLGPDAEGTPAFDKRGKKGLLLLKRAFGDGDLLFARHRERDGVIHRWGLQATKGK